MCFSSGEIRRHAVLLATPDKHKSFIQTVLENVRGNQKTKKRPMIHILHPSIHPESAGDGRDWEKYCAQSYKKVLRIQRSSWLKLLRSLWRCDSYTSQDYKLKIGVDIVVGTPDRIKCGEAGHNSAGCPKFPKEKKNQKSKEIDEAGASTSQPSQAPETLTFSQGPEAFTQESNI